MTEVARLNRRAAEPKFLVDRVDSYYRERVERLWQGRHPLKGGTPSADSIQLRSNDYLCLGGDARVIAAEVAALQARGHGMSVSRVWLHHMRDALSAFEARLADLMQAEAAVLASSGYCANVGLVQSFVAPDARVYIDMKAHISLWEGIKSAGAVPTPFRHNDLGHLERLVRQHGPGFVMVDALYSTDGAMCPLDDLVALSERTGCALVVDETHSFGTFGRDGAGLVCELGLADRVHFRTLGLSKAVASRGAAVVCSARNAEFLRYEALPTIFSTQILEHEAAGYHAVLDVIRDEPWRRSRLHAAHARLRRGLDELGYNVDASSAQIIALEAGDIVQTVALRDALESRGVFGAIFFPPATADKRCLIRFTANCGLTDGDIDRVLAVCRDIRAEVGLAGWASTRRRKGIAAIAGVRARSAVLAVRS